MAKRRIIALDRQTPVDIALQEHGSVEALFTVVNDDGAVSDITQPLTPGASLKVSSKPVDGDVTRFYAARAFKPVTGNVLPVFFCVGPGCFPADFVEPGAMQVQTTTGYVTVRQGSSAITYGSGTTDLVLIEHAAGELCLYSSDSAGNPAGNVSVLLCGANARWWEFKWLNQLEVLTFFFASLRDIDLSVHETLFAADLYSGPGNRLLHLPVSNQIQMLVTHGFGVKNTDQVVNRMNAAIPGGTLQLNGGTPRTAASEDNYDQLILAGWTIDTP